MLWVSSGASEDIQSCKWALECPEKKETLNKDIIIRGQNVQGINLNHMNWLTTAYKLTWELWRKNVKLFSAL